jgi:hypothetical protein
MLETTYSDAQFDRFLCASLFEQDGMPVSVLSALARLDLDPWQEAARLASLAKDHAVNSLAATIWKGNSDRWSAMEASLQAMRLVELLPAPRKLVDVASIASRIDGQCAMWLAYGIALGMIALSTGNPQQTANTGASSGTTEISMASHEAPVSPVRINTDWARSP